MKTIICFVILAALAVAQTTVNPPAVVISAEGVASLNQWILTQRYEITFTLSTAIDAATTAIRVSDGAGLQGKVLVIDGEAMLVTARTGRDLTVTRSVLGTAAVGHAENAAGSVLKYSDLRELSQRIVLDKLREIIWATPTATILTKRKAQAALDAEIETAKTTAVQ